MQEHPASPVVYGDKARFRPAGRIVVDSQVPFLELISLRCAAHFVTVASRYLHLLACTRALDSLPSRVALHVSFQTLLRLRLIS